MRIRRDVLDEVIDHARDSRPSECCGILLADTVAPDVVSRAMLAANVEKECPERAYALGHEAHLDAVKAEASGEAVIAGYYHSHPFGTPRPSSRDAADAVEGLKYVIVGFPEGRIDVTVWEWLEGVFSKEPLEVV